MRIDTPISTGAWDGPCPGEGTRVLRHLAASALIIAIVFGACQGMAPAAEEVAPVGRDALAPTAAATPPPLVWGQQYDATVAQARAAHRPLLIMMSEDGCGLCDAWLKSIAEQPSL